MNRKLKLYPLVVQQAALWALVVALALLLALSLAEGLTLGAGAQGGPALSVAEGSQGATTQPRTLTYSYDAAGRLTQADYGGGVALHYRYDPSGNLVGVSPGGGYQVYLPLVLRSSPAP